LGVSFFPLHETTLADNTAWVGITITRDEITPIP
jgi:hypothetical protein